MAQAIGIFIIFLVCVALMMTRKLPTILALPIMAVAIALMAGIPFMSGEKDVYTIAKDVLEGGAMRMSTAIAGLIFGGWFGKILTKCGITHTIIRKAAEMAGDKPVAIALAFLAVCSIIFAASSGLGVVILVGTIIIPIMISAGVSPFAAGAVLLCANGIGVTFNVGNLGVYIDALGLPIATVTSYSWLCGIPLIIFSVLMILWFIKKGGRRHAWAMPADDSAAGEKNARNIALVAPVIPVILVFAFNMQLVPAIMIGIVLALILSTPRNPIQKATSAFVEGIQDTAGAVALMIGIGMTLKSVMAPQVAKVLSPLIAEVIPQNHLMFVVVFGLLSFLAIYRGPLNVWGLGSGIVALLAASGMNPVAAMVALRLDSNVQSVCDPTNSHNVWVSDFVKTDVNEYLRKALPWMMASTLIGLIVASLFIY